MPYVLKLWIKVIPDWGILFCQLQLIRSVIEQLTITITTAIMAQGQIRSFSIIRSTLDVMPFILTIIFFYYGFPPYTMYLAWIACGSILGNVTLVYFSHHLCSVSYREFFSVVLWPCTLITIVMCAMGLLPVLFMGPSIYRLILTSILTSLGLLATARILMSKYEYTMIKEMVTSLTKRILKSEKNV
jgi:hypothetical protein